MKLGVFIFKKDKEKFLKENFYDATRIFLLIVIPLLVIAAIIEGILISLWLSFQVTDAKHDEDKSNHDYHPD